ncbi:Transaldolase [Fusarium oxysporum f. sp. albedinis]|nr:Transaldolase [Fusarium oxysporum f. sp. albedinis]
MYPVVTGRLEQLPINTFNVILLIRNYNAEFDFRSHPDIMGCMCPGSANILPIVQFDLTDMPRHVGANHQMSLLARQCILNCSIIFLAEQSQKTAGA